MSDIIETLDINLRLMVSTTAKFLAFSLIALIAMYVYSNSPYEIYARYFLYFSTFVMSATLAGIITWLVWAFRNYCADTVTIGIMGQITAKIFATYFLSFGAVSCTVAVALYSSVISKPLFAGALVIAAMVALWKLDTFFEDRFQEGILRDLQS